MVKSYCSDSQAWIFVLQTISQSVPSRRSRGRDSNKAILFIIGGYAENASPLGQLRRYQGDSPMSLLRHNRCHWVGLPTARHSFSQLLGLTEKRTLGYIVASPLAKVAELADAQDSGFCGLIPREGSSPSFRTNADEGGAARTKTAGPPSYLRIWHSIKPTTQA